MPVKTGNNGGTVSERPLQYENFHQILVNKAKHFGSKDYTISVDQGKSITFDQINTYCNKVANFLQNKDIKKDDKISLIEKNSIETIIIFLGVLRYGAIINPINSEESKENVHSIVKRVNPKMVIYNSQIDLCGLPTPSSETEFIKREEAFSLIETCDSVFQGHLGSKDDIAEIVFTSGTTEFPKGIVISREGIFYMVNEVIEKLGITEKDRILEYRAYNWVSAQLLTILSSMIAGATLILAQKFSRTGFPNWVKEHDITISSGVPTVFNILLSDPVNLHKKDVNKLKFITSSSAPLSIEKLHAFERTYGIPINQMAGMSEAGWMFGNALDKRKIGSVGTPFRFKTIEIINQHGKKCKRGEEGEIVVKGKSMGLGYLMEGGGIERFPIEGLHTGDLGYMDSDGYFYLTGRKKDLIIRGGVNISPAEITDRIMKHPCVKEAVTIGVVDSIYGEDIASFIVPQKGSKINEQDILSHCREKLPDFKLPKIIRFLEEIPKTRNEKVSKQALLQFVIRKDKSGRSQTSV
jgi:acyl-coenzyme A synthetase/AMP-(fatty) acid ligase